MLICICSLQLILAHAHLHLFTSYLGSSDHLYLLGPDLLYAEFLCVSSKNIFIYKSVRLRFSKYTVEHRRLVHMFLHKFTARKFALHISNNSFKPKY